MCANSINMALSTSYSCFIRTTPEGNKANILSFLEQVSSKILTGLSKARDTY